MARLKRPELAAEARRRSTEVLARLGDGCEVRGAGDGGLGQNSPAGWASSNRRSAISNEGAARACRSTSGSGPSSSSIATCVSRQHGIHGTNPRTPATSRCSSCCCAGTRDWAHRLVRAPNQAGGALAVHRCRHPRRSPPRSHPCRVLEHLRRHRRRGAQHHPEAGRGRHTAKGESVRTTPTVSPAACHSRDDPKPGAREPLPGTVQSALSRLVGRLVQTLTDGGVPPDKVGLIWTDVAGSRLFPWRRRSTR
jgi:hypothetical protein